MKKHTLSKQINSVSYWIHVLKLIPSLVLLLLMFSVSNNVYAQSSIFGGDGGGSSGIFGDIRNQIRYIFEGRDVELGGSTAPYSPSTPNVTDPGAPAPDSGNFLKVWVEWDSMLRGNSSGNTLGEAVVQLDQEPQGFWGKLEHSVSSLLGIDNETNYIDIDLGSVLQANSSADFCEDNDIIVIEAENFSANSTDFNSNGDFSLVTNASASGSQAVQVKANVDGREGEEVGGTETGPEGKISYTIDFETGGRWYVWLRTQAADHENNGLFLEFDNQRVFAPSDSTVAGADAIWIYNYGLNNPSVPEWFWNPHWQSATINGSDGHALRVRPITIDVSPGVHTLSIVKRLIERPLIDKIILTRTNSEPSGLGDPETLCSGNTSAPPPSIPPSGISACSLAASNTPPSYPDQPYGNGDSYYIAPNGNDNNPGTEAQPWATLAYALKSNNTAANSPVGPGDTIFLREGTYQEGLLIFNDENQQGEDGNYLTITSYPGETATLRNTGLRFRDRDYMRVQGLRFEQLPTYGVLSRSWTRPIKGFQVINNYFENDGSMHGQPNVGMSFIAASTRGERGNPPDQFVELTDVTIAGNTIIDNNDNAIHGSGEAIQPSGNTDYVTVVNNIIHGVDNIGIGFAGRPWKNVSCDNGQCQPDNGLIKNNVIYDYGSPGESSAAIYLDAVGSFFIVENNVVYDGLAGIRASNEPETSPLNANNIIFRRNIAYNQTIYNHKLGTGTNDCLQGIGGPVNNSVSVHNTFSLDIETNMNARITCGNNLRVKNNIFSRFNTGDNRQYNSPATNSDRSSWESDFNIFYSASGSNAFVWGASNYSSLNSFSSSTGFDVNSINLDPAFEGTGNNNFNISSSSPAIDTGGPLTTTISSGTGTAVQVADARYFSNGFGLQGGDLVIIGDNPPTEIVAVDYGNNTLDLTSSISWQNGDPVSYNYAEDGPDIGACESTYVATVGGTVSPSPGGTSPGGAVGTGIIGGIGPFDIEPADPIEELHKDYIVQNGCCTDCGEEAIVDPCQRCDVLGTCNECALPGYYNAEPIKHVLWGWCGQDAFLDTTYLPSPDGNVNAASIPLDSPGPNDNVLPNAINNKFIRRDGYVYQCVQVACFVQNLTPTPTPLVTPITPIPTPTPIYTPADRYNYMEFQTMIFHSNDFIVELYLENLGNTPINDIAVRRHIPNNTSDFDDDSSWAHNIDVGQGSGIPTIWGPVLEQYIHGSSEPAKEESGRNLQPFDSTYFVQYPDQGLRNTIPTMPGTYGPGALTPRDYNFVCDPNDGNESERCSTQTLLVPINPNDHPICYDNQCFSHFRDVTQLGGCGYNASSNNSIIGPIEYEILYGDGLASRSIVRFSIPVGNPLDDESIPFGWPTSGRISENWGNTGQAQEAGTYRNLFGQSRREYAEYLFCPGQGETYPLDGRPRAGDRLHPGIDIEPATSTVRPPNVYTTHAGYVTFAGYDPAYPDKGYTVQIETDVNRDATPDIITRYTHLLEGSLTFDAIDKRNPFSADGFRHAYGTGAYVPRHSLIGRMSDSGSEGITQTQYEILYITPNEPTLPLSGDIGPTRCTDDPYEESCIDASMNQFFSKLRFDPQLIFGPVYTNP